MNRHSAEDSPDFDPLAQVYRWMEFFSFGPLLARCRFCYLAQASDLHRVLVLGDGDGRYTQRLLQRNPRVHLTAVDSSRAMLAALQRRAAAVGAADRVTLVHQDLRSFTPDGRFDGVVTHFSLDCLTEVAIEGLVTRILPSLNSGSLWIVSEFAIPAGRARAAAARMLIGFLYFVFRVLTGLRTQQLPNYAEILVRHGFRRTDYSQWLGGLLTAEVWSLEPLTPQPASDGRIL